MAIIGIIPARGGSKGIPRKNLVDIDGKSLVERTARVALESALDRVVVYSDDPEILDVARALGVEAMERPADVSGDRVTSEETIVRCMADNRIRGAVMMLQCTTPFLEPVYINQAIDALKDPTKGYDSVISVTPLHRYLGYMADKKPLVGWTPMFPYRFRRQDRQAVYYMENGAFYLATRKIWEKGRRFGRRCAIVEMPVWSSLEIDEPIDLEIARAMAPVIGRRESCTSSS